MSERAVLISIQPKWCEKIANCEKTIEVRKTRPKLETPFKVYIYCTRPYTGSTDDNFYIYPNDKPRKVNGYVIGEFICDRIEEFSQWEYDYASLLRHIDLYAGTNGDYKFLDDYLKGHKKGYGWHISDLKIYDKPKELGEFKVLCRDAYCQEEYGDKIWFCKDGYGSCSVKEKEREYPYNDECIYFDCPSVGGESCGYEDYAYCNCKGLKPITRPPQSWKYVEPLKENADD